ncbi:MAG: RyR domain-containing protein, partial [Streptosporangiaceae bacterium]
DGHPERHHFQLAGDPQAADTLRSAGVGRAKTVYAFAEDTAANLGTALTAKAVHRPGAENLTSYVHVEEPELCQALRARRLGMAGDAGDRVDFVNSSELAARVLVEGTRPNRVIRHLAIVGLGPFGRSLLLELTRQQRALTGRTGRARLTVVDARVGEIMENLVARYPFLRHWDWTTIECPPSQFHLGGWSSDLPADSEPDQTYLCGADPVSALRGALTAVRLWHGDPQSLVVCLENSLTYGDVFQTEAEALLDGLGGVLHIFGVLEAACRSEFDGQEMIEQLARSIHELYVTSCLSGEEVRTDNEVLAPWHELPETYLRSSRAQAAHVGLKLRAIGCMAAPTESGPNLFAFAENEVELLAELEHQRWLDERASDGWRYGLVRSQADQSSPSMVPWSQLSEADRMKDREFVLALPGLLADVGLRIVRTGTRRSLRPVR